MKSLYRVIERRPSVFIVQKRALIGWITIRDPEHSARIDRTWGTKDNAENWIKAQIPFDAFHPRVVSEWFITGVQKPNGK